MFPSRRLARPKVLARDNHGAVLCFVLSSPRQKPPLLPPIPLLLVSIGLSLSSLFLSRFLRPLCLLFPSAYAQVGCGRRCFWVGVAPYRVGCGMNFPWASPHFRFRSRKPGNVAGLWPAAGSGTSMIENNLFYRGAVPALP